MVLSTSVVFRHEAKTWYLIVNDIDGSGVIMQVGHGNPEWKPRKDFDLNSPVRKHPRHSYPRTTVALGLELIKKYGLDGEEVKR